MTKIVVTIAIATATPIAPEVVDVLKEDLEDIVREGGVHGVTVEVEVLS